MATPLKLSKIIFKSGSEPEEAHLEVEVPTVVVFVGPNNSGKSLALREIEGFCCAIPSHKKIISNVEIVFPDTEDEALSLVNEYKTDPPQQHMKNEDHVWVGLPTFRDSQPVLHEQVPISAIKSVVTERNEPFLIRYLSRFYTIRLDGRTRFSLSDPKPTGDLLKHPQNHLWALFLDDENRSKVSKLTSEAFGLYFVIDPTAMTQFRVKMGKRKPVSTAEEQALGSKARDFFKECANISELSDGVQAFTGLVSAVLSLKHRIILIDEPEAFLHPPLARRLGKNLSNIAEERGASLVVATHSAEFLMGCIEATTQLLIVRLTYEEGIDTTRAIKPTNLQQLMHDPLLRSTQALRGLFHRCVIVTEADKDRAFYEEINHRLQELGEGIEDCLFLNAQNWQTIPRIVMPLRELGIPAAAIMDLDVVSEGAPWDKIYEMLCVTEEEKEALEELRTKCESILKEPPSTVEGSKEYKKYGMSLLSGDDLTNIKTFLLELKKYGLFIVNVGEVESWLSYLGIPHEPKKTWLTRLFERIGAESGSPSYVRPRDNDVWDFLRSIRHWIDDPKRKGRP